MKQRAVDLFSIELVIDISTKSIAGVCVVDSRVQVTRIFIWNSLIDPPVLNAWAFLLQTNLANGGPFIAGFIVEARCGEFKAFSFIFKS